MGLRVRGTRAKRNPSDPGMAGKGHFGREKRLRGRGWVRERLALAGSGGTHPTVPARHG